MSGVHPTYRKLSLFTGVWYGSVAVGWAMLAIAFVVVSTSSLTRAGAPLAMTAVLLVMLDLLPIVQGRGHDPQGVVMSTAFVCAILLHVGALARRPRSQPRDFRLGPADEEGAMEGLLQRRPVQPFDSASHTWS